MLSNPGPQLRSHAPLPFQDVCSQERPGLTAGHVGVKAQGTLWARRGLFGRREDGHRRRRLGEGAGIQLFSLQHPPEVSPDVRVALLLGYQARLGAAGFVKH